MLGWIYRLGTLVKFLKLLTMTVASQEGCPGPGSASRLSPQGRELGRQEAVEGGPA